MQRVVAFLTSAPMPFVVTFRTGEESRRDAQNRCAFEIYKQVAGILDDRSPQDVRAESKLCVGIPILRAESDSFRADYDAILKPLPYEAKLKLMVEPFDMPITRLMTVRQMSDYITALLAYWDRAGASVLMPPGFDP